MNITYKGFKGTFAFCGVTGCYYGEVIDREVLISFQASYPNAAIQAMHQAVDQYLEWALMDAQDDEYPSVSNTGNRPPQH